MFLKCKSVLKVLGLFCFCFYEGRPDVIYSTDSHSAYAPCDISSCPSGYICSLETNMCVPYCSFDCGPGRCAAPEECECDHGYYSEALTEDSEPPRCKPLCEFCEGTCIQPYTCVCDPDFEAIHLSADGGDCDCFGNCTGRICESTKCVPKAADEKVETTTKDLPILIDTSTSCSTTRSNEDINHDKDVTVNTITEEDYSYELFSTETDINQFYLDNFEETETERRRNETENQGLFTWIYVTAGLVALLIVVTVLIIKRNAVLYCFSGNSYSVVEGKPGESQSHSMDMNFLTIE